MDKHYFCFALLLFIARAVDSQLFQGDTCVHTESRLNGRCTLFQDCPSALDDFRRGSLPQTCGFEGTLPIVCCPGSSATVTTSTTTTTTTTRKPTIANPTSKWKADSHAFYGLPDGQVGMKSYEKCREYAKFVNVSYQVPGFQTIRQRSECGFKAVPLVVGGTKAKTREFPHMAAVGYDAGGTERAYVCGGSLISERFVLTAGHCLHTQNYGKAKYVRLGDLILRNDTEEALPQEYDVIEIIRHPQYQPPSQYNDIGLLKMNAAATFNSFVRPICLAVHRNSPTRRAIATGWGNVEFHGASSDHLLKVTLEFFTFNECNASYEANNRKLKNGLDDTTQMCAGSKEERKDTCQGDSGGPLQIYHEDLPDAYCMYMLLGVTSFGKACGISKSPGVYSRVYHYLGWIEDTVWP